LSVSEILIFNYYRWLREGHRAKIIPLL